MESCSLCRASSSVAPVTQNARRSFSIELPLSLSFSRRVTAEMWNGTVRDEIGYGKGGKLVRTVCHVSITFTYDLVFELAFLVRHAFIHCGGDFCGCGLKLISSFLTLLLK